VTSRTTTLVRGSNASERTSHLCEALRDVPSHTHVTLVSATREGASDLFRAATRTRAATFGWHRTNLAGLAQSIAGPSLLADGLAPASRLTLEAICARVVHTLRAANALGRFTPIADRPGLPRALARTLDELRMGRVDLAELTALDPDVARILGSYERELRETAVIDRATVFDRAADVLAHDAPPHEVLVLADVAIWTAAETRFVSALLATASKSMIAIPSGDERTAHALTGRFTREVDLDAAPSVSSLTALQRRLFSPQNAPATDASVEVFSAPGESRECVEVARAILREAASGTPFDRMAIVLRSPAQYRAHVQEALRRAGVPGWFARGARLPDPSGRAFLALLACAADGLSATRFAEYLSLGELPDAEEGKPPAPIAASDRYVEADELLDGPRDEVATAPVHDERPPRSSKPAPDPDANAVNEGTLRAPRWWERILVDAAVLGGRTRWERRLRGHHEKLARALREIDDPDDARAQGIRREQRALQSLREFALPLLDDLAALPERDTWGVWLDRLGALATRALARPERVLAVIEELRPMANVGPVELTEVRLVLEPRLGTLVRPAEGSRYGAVFVGSPDEIRGMSFDAVFVPALAEKLFPLRVSEDPILPDTMRASLSSLATNRDRTAGERLALRLAIGAASKRLVISYPRIDVEQARPRTPSFYGLEVLRAAEGSLPGLEELAQRAHAARGTRLAWPAPNDPMEAIDDAEHDLALLERTLELPEERVVGAARYLLTANAHLARALRARRARWSKQWESADGLVEPAEQAKTALAAHALERRSYSATALQNYASCPYRFLLQAVHRLAPREEPEPIEELDALQRGSLVHETQFELLTTLRTQNLLPVTPANLPAARQFLESALDRVAARFRDDLAPAIDRVWEDAVASIRADLREWLRRASTESKWVPAYFELAFGLNDNSDRDKEFSTPEAIELECGIRLRGSIDLVERSANEHLRATDHKTGKVRVEPGAVIAGGKSLQPVLYALALERRFRDATVDAGRLYYCTSTGNFTPVEIPLTQEARDAARLVADTIGDALDQGFFPASPNDRECEYCDYRPICGPHEERRSRRKPPAQVMPLYALRRAR
jgi:CRISPR/Cas system-associated exonuclease Cas4 (RecB family)